jgi:hypothetical protein
LYSQRKVGLARLDHDSMSRLPFAFFAARVLLALLVVALGTVFATRSPAVDTTAAQAPAAVEAPVDLPAPVEPTPVVKRGTPLDFVICITNSSWTRPSAQAEAEYLATSASHATFEDIAAQFRAPFWRDAGNDGSFDAILELTGLWMTREQGLDLGLISRAGCPALPASRAGLVNIWMLGYQADSVRIDEGRIVVYTKVKRAGFQAIQLRLTGDGNPKIMPIDFMNESGYRIETIPANSTWSSAP